MLEFLNKKSPILLLGTGLVAFGAAMVLVAKAAPKGRDILTESEGELDTWTKTKKLAPIFAPSVGAFLFGTGCVLAANRINATRYAGLLAAYSITDQALVKWQETTLAELGKKKFEQVRKETNKPPASAIPDENTLILGGEPNVLFWDSYCGRLFWAPNVEHIHRAVNLANQTAQLDDWVSLNELYYEMGLPKVDFGDEVGWGAEGHLLDVVLDSFLIEERELTPISISFTPFPQPRSYV